MPKALGKLIGAANMVTIAYVGKQHLDRFMQGLGAPVSSHWMHIRTEAETLWQDGSIRDGVAYFSGVIKANGRDVKYNLTVPVVIREGKLLEPAVFKCGEATNVLTKEAMENLFRGVQFPRPIPARDYLYGMPPPPGLAPPSRTMTDPFTGLR